MAGDFLSQEEVDALLKSVCSEDLNDEESRTSDPVPVNLGVDSRIVRGRLPLLELANERFARNYRKVLFDEIGRNVEFSVGPVRTQQYSNFIRNLVVPTNLNLVKIGPDCEHFGLIIFDPNLIFLTVDNIFGGDGRFHTRVEGRDFTPTENAVIDMLLRTTIRTYLKGFSKYVPISFIPHRREMNSQFANIASPKETVISTTFTLEFGGATADMHICFPYAAIEKHINTLKSSLQDLSPTVNKAINIDNVKVDIEHHVVLGEITLANLPSLKDILGATFEFGANKDSSFIASGFIKAGNKIIDHLDFEVNVK